MTPPSAPDAQPASGSTAPRSSVPPTWPATGLGRTSLALSIVALVSIVALPLTTALFGETVPLTDTVMMPLIGTALLLTASVLGVVAVSMRRHRSVVTIALLTAVLAATVFIAPIVIGEALGELL